MRSAHVIVEAEHRLPSESRRPRKAGGIVQSDSLRARGADGANRSPKAGGDEVGRLSSSSEAGAKERIPPPSFSFGLCQPSMGLADARCWGWGWVGDIGSAQSPDSPTNVICKHLHRHTQKQRLSRAPCGPVRLMHKTNHDGDLRRQCLRLGEASFCIPVKQRLLSLQD